jgi:hypothetical protein
MYVLGGFFDDDEDGDTTDSVLKFDSAQGTWSEVASMPEGRHKFAAYAVGSDIFVFGGGDDMYQVQSSVFKYDTVADDWSTLDPMPYSCFDISASVLDGLVYRVGALPYVVRRFDPASGAWSIIAPTLMDHTEGSTFVLDGCLYAAGGGDIDDEHSHSGVERYDVASNTWTAVANMLGARSHFGVSTTSKGQVEEQDLFDSLIAKAVRRLP